MIILLVAIILALIFAYTNGFHDSANAIATVVSTKVLSPRIAVTYGALLNFCGAFFGTEVAKTIGEGLVSGTSITAMVIVFALLGAIIWNIITWYYGLPSSSSHALIGGLLGVAVVHGGFHVVKFGNVINKVIIPMVTSPLIGVLITFIFILILLWLVHKFTPHFVNKHFGHLQLISSGLMAFSHGANDTQKTMGIITIALVNFYALKSFQVPLWVIIICALSMALGTMIGGWRIIRTMGHKIIKLKPIHGFAAETCAAGMLLTASVMGIPLSTTQVISGAIIGAGISKRFSAVKWGIVGNMVFAWILTIPMCAVFSGLLYYLAVKIT